MGVFCSSLKKICQIIKKHILGADDDSEQATGRNRTFDAMVEPNYRQYPLNADACANATSRQWNPTVDVVRSWIELCRPEAWAHRRFVRMICLDPLNILQGDMTLDMVRVYVDTIRGQLQTIAGEATDWQQRDRVDTIVIPI